MTSGWIINLYSLDETKQVERDQPPVFFNIQGEPVFEVWFWHPLLNRWFVMSAEVRGPEQQLSESDVFEAQGVVYFHPREVPEQLRERMREMERVAGLSCSACGLPQSLTSSGLVCANGHGGAEAMDPHGRPTELS